jgi:D-3-phosphoglycerate dehydrogenase
MSNFLVGLTRDMLDANGAPTFGQEALRKLETKTRVAWEWLPDEVRELTPEHAARYDALYIGMPLVTRATFAGGTPRTRIIARHGVGYDSVDIAACTDAGVIVTIQPDGVRRPVAVMAMSFILALSQKMLIKDRLTRAGRWAEKVNHMGMGLIGRTLGLIGAGSIGREIMRLARPFGLNVIATDPYVDPALVEAEGARLTDFDTVMRESDFVVVISLLTPETRHLVNERAFALMKPSAYFINVARGPIVDEAALIATLQAGRIAGAALDVFEQEPVDPKNPLLTMENVIVTPHALCWTDQCFSGLAESGLTTIMDAFAGKRPRNVVNAAVLDDPRLSSWLSSRA